MIDKPLSRENLIQTIRDAAKPRTVTRAIERSIFDADGTLLRTEREVQKWTEPGDVGAMQWLEEHSRFYTDLAAR